MMIQVEELTDDLLEFHEAVNSLQQQEEDVIEEHRELVGVRQTSCIYAGVIKLHVTKQLCLRCSLV